MRLTFEQLAQLDRKATAEQVIAKMHKQVRYAKRFFDALQAERGNQIDKFGYNKHELYAWLYILKKYVEKMEDAAWAVNEQEFKKRLIQVGALVLAMFEQMEEEREHKKNDE